MSTFRTHLSLLEDTAAEHTSVPALKVAVQGPTGINWRDISYAAFRRDVALSARYWAQEFSKAGIEERSVISLWLKGTSYEDLIHAWGISRAGFIPQLISLRMTDPTVVYELCTKAQAVAIIHDISFAPILKDSPIPTFHAENVLKVPGLEELPLQPLCSSPQAEDVVMIYHSSGSTSGIPKLVPLTFKWIDHFINKLHLYTGALPPLSRQRVGVSVGSFSHLGNVTFLLESMSQLGPFIIPSSIPYPMSELSQMIDQCGLTRLNMFPPFLSAVLRVARQDASLLKRLQSLDSIAYGGMPLDAGDETWARSQGLNLANGFGSTEMGIIMTSKATPQTPYLEAWPGARFEMVPLEDKDLPEKLLQLVIPPEFPECPHHSLRDPKDGKFYSGDFFVEVAPGQYISRGRNDDWIKMEAALRCDTGSIEANAAQTCQDLISNVVVVGVARPSPAMVVELKHNNVSDESQIKREILERITPFHKRRYTHERIEDDCLIFIAPKGTLPRTATKGSIRRVAVEEMFKAELDKIYGKRNG